MRLLIVPVLLALTVLQLVCAHDELELFPQPQQTQPLLPQEQGLPPSSTSMSRPGYRPRQVHKNKPRKPDILPKPQPAPDCEGAFVRVGVYCAQRGMRNRRYYIACKPLDDNDLPIASVQSVKHFHWCPEGYACAKYLLEGQTPADTFKGVWLPHPLAPPEPRTVCLPWYDVPESTKRNRAGRKRTRPGGEDHVEDETVEQRPKRAKVKNKKVATTAVEERNWQFGFVPESSTGQLFSAGSSSNRPGS